MKQREQEKQRPQVRDSLMLHMRLSIEEAKALDRRVAQVSVEAGVQLRRSDVIKAILFGRQKAI